MIKNYKTRPQAVKPSKGESRPRGNDTVDGEKHGKEHGGYCLWNLCNKKSDPGHKFYSDYECDQNGYKERKTMDSDYCSKHTCCVNKCTMRVKFRSLYCEQHGCKVWDCPRAATQEASNFCQPHTCTICKEWNDEQGPACSECAPQTGPMPRSFRRIRRSGVGRVGKGQ